MKLLKVIGDSIIKTTQGKNYVPAGLVELNKYFRHYEPIVFKYHKEGDETVAVSENFKYGSIIAAGKDDKELDKNIKDAILTSFEIPSSYKDEAGIIRQGEEKKQYVLA